MYFKNKYTIVVSVVSTQQNLCSHDKNNSQRAIERQMILRKIT